MKSPSHLCFALVVLSVAGCANPSNEIASIAEKSTAVPQAARVADARAEATPAAKREANRERRMDIVNQTGHTIQHFYATNTSVKKWGRDLLGEAVIPPGQSYRFDFNDGTGACSFDFRAVLDNGRPIERYNVNVCTSTAWILRLGDQPSGAGGRRDNAPSPAQPGLPVPKGNPKRDLGV
jgi:hypothetical protein